MSSSRKRQVKSGRGADKSRRNPRTYYAITKDSKDIYRYASYDDRQRAIETEELDGLTAQEFLQYQAQGKACIHVIPPQLTMTGESSAPPRVELPVIPPSSPHSYTESPIPESNSGAGPAESFPVSEKITEAAHHAMAKIGEASPSITMSMEQCKQLIVAAIVEALQIFQAQHGGKSVVPASTGAIVGEQPTGNRTQNH